ncbi:hypothetical protein BDB01DRAFT_847130 [Pilobolus umbonatus]|nr:hypothetical protein BDB01DRAFT_847130 [Pilobolus umbonatus]
MYRRKEEELRLELPKFALHPDVNLNDLFEEYNIVLCWDLIIFPGLLLLITALAKIALELTLATDDVRISDWVAVRITQDQIDNEALGRVALEIYIKVKDLPSSKVLIGRNGREVANGD